MTKAALRRALDSGTGASGVLLRGNLQSLIYIWKLDQTYYLTWEESPENAQHDASQYTRDERHEFPSLDKLFGFLTRSSVPLASFQPNP
jgi:hypothetical protein